VSQKNELLIQSKSKHEYNMISYLSSVEKGKITINTEDSE